MTFLQHMSIVALAVATLTATSAQPVAAILSPASTNWLAAQAVFQNAGERIGEKKFAAAKEALLYGTTNLPAPYSGMSTQFIQRLDGIIKEQKSEIRTHQAAELCADLQSYSAALKVKPPKVALTDEDEEDDSVAWWLFESGDMKGALSRYERKLRLERVPVYKDYYRKQIQMIREWTANMSNSAFALDLIRERYMKGYERKPDSFGALRQLHRVLPYPTDSTNGVLIYQQFIICLSRLGDAAGRDAWENKLLADFKPEIEACAGVYYDRGIRAYHEWRDFETALNWMRRVCAEFPGAKLWGDGQYSVGLILQDQKKYDDAIAAFDIIFFSKVNDYLLEEGSSEDCKNYRFKAALRISECYEAKNDLARALEFARKATTQYPYVSFCSLCQKQGREGASKRVAELETKIKRSQ
jgi:tetratricopeptide (TPR) repeat protein